MSDLLESALKYGAACKRLVDAKLENANEQITAALFVEIDRLRASLTELRNACAEKQRCIDSSVEAQRAFLAEIDALRDELAEAGRDAGRYRRLCSLVAWGTLGVCRVAEAGDDYADDGVMLDAWLDDPEMIAEVQGIDAAMAGGE